MKNKENKRSIVTKGDIILIVCLLLLPLGVFVFSLLPENSTAESVVISVDGEEYAVYPLDEDRTVTLESNGVKSVIEISAKTVRVNEATCPGNDCVRQGVISRPGETIVCLPARIVITLSGGNEQSSDSVTY